MARQGLSTSTGLHRLVLVLLLVVTAIALHVVRVPFPLLPILLFDLAGVPLVVASLVSLRATTLMGLPLFYLGVLALGSLEPIGPFMKAFAEFSTYLPVALMHEKFVSKWGYSLKTKMFLVVLATASRVVFMALLNIAFTPLYLMYFLGLATNYWEGLLMVLQILHLISLFNVIAAVYTVLLAFPVISILKKLRTIPI
ncbi:MAG: hypothetical protein DRO13_00255 [Thermoprotei archaeon]|nr:MAG: hypothetical protein DRO13_00010 [Thermoprotei archaeon]RLG81831.1 MAG: hypothetical protein DRO13_00255 [Thermoprotei archaeon]